MKLRNIFRTQVVAIGFAAALSLAGGARAQEIDNTVWADTANVEVFPQPARLVAADQLNNSTATYAPQTAIAAVTARPAVSKEAIISGGPSSEGWLIGSSILLMSPVAVLALSRLRRAKHGQTVRAYHNKRSTALS